MDFALDVLEYLKLVLFLVNVLVAAFIYTRSRTGGGDGAEARRGPVLFVTAHPDDEAMFFVPSILSLAKTNRTIHLLCLSTGDFECSSSGQVRVKEIHASAKVLGIKERNIKVVDDKELKDGPQNQWDEDKIAQIVREYVDTKAVETVITFDEGGVSSHPNHIAAFHGVARFLALHAVSPPSPTSSASATASTLSHRGSASSASTSTAPPSSLRGELRGFKLETTNLARKYVGLLDVVWSSWTSEGVVFVTPWLSFWPSHRAMLAHQSQYVWFRRLYVPFSRYSYVNTLLPITFSTAPSSSSSH